MSNAATKPVPKSTSATTLSSSSTFTNSVIPESSSAILRPQPSSDFLSQALATTDLIFGIYAIELWHYNEASGKLINVGLGSSDEETGRKSGDLFLKRRTQESDPDSDNYTPEANHAFDKLTDKSRNDYIPAKPSDPGVGLSGLLWSESSTAVGGGVNNMLGNALHINGNQRPNNERQSSQRRGKSFKGIHSNAHDTIVWRDVVGLANDPDQPYDERLQEYAKAGFKLATGVPFDINGWRGIVIYFANPHAQSEKLLNPINSNLINNSAQFIGAAATIQGSMGQVQAFREELSYQNWHRMKVKLLTIIRFGGSLRAKAPQQEVEMTSNPGMKRKMSLREMASSYGKSVNQSFREAKDGAKSKGARWLKKIHGGSAGIPPSFGYRQCMWTFIGVMTTHTILSRINLLVQDESDGDISLILAPLGALTTLQYNLTAAPASQPRNAIFAQIFAITTAILLSYIPNVEPWFRSALAPAIVIPGMAKLGIIHPPAGAAAIVFASGKVRWEHFGIFLCGVAISIITAVGINNMSDKRQYPTSWYFLNKAKGFMVTS
mmetsp:Transcript_34507/g.83519  ORF Transcript_34507/g.83519 Transcript_34507/m.83519 type:complete len:550 (+) Transcript_34507:35-1684(+)|eukprot:CAMPEP_0181088154 /NCGR_PEP_ID=MMETSP1071-20121207/6638_1 /TAXON_ID=35127 /ORGANISM="Thalassiosira sp., Strain NH16" /LENGTH=549 /DNA_ID=CAMNT_0023170057 /DNA_START=26 /DNA_END=1675 /DNA_ORIENTATION=-